MTLEEKREAAIKHLVDLGIWKSSVTPPLWRALWKMGFNIPPAPFCNFWLIASLMGLPYGVLWGWFMWVFQWASIGMSPTRAVLTSLFGAVLFGTSMAAVARFFLRKHKLPSWEDFGK